MSLRSRSRSSQLAPTAGTMFGCSVVEEMSLSEVAQSALFQLRCPEHNAGTTRTGSVATDPVNRLRPTGANARHYGIRPDRNSASITGRLVFCLIRAPFGGVVRFLFCPVSRIVRSIFCVVSNVFCSIPRLVPTFRAFFSGPVGSPVRSLLRSVPALHALVFRPSCCIRCILTHFGPGLTNRAAQIGFAGLVTRVFSMGSGNLG